MDIELFQKLIGESIGPPADELLPIDSALFSAMCGSMRRRTVLSDAKLNSLLKPFLYVCEQSELVNVVGRGVGVAESGFNRLAQSVPQKSWPGESEVR